MKKLILLLFILILNCSTKTQNKVKLSIPDLLPMMTSGSLSYFYLYDREINTELTPNCGIATPATTTGTTGSTTAGSSGGSSTTKFTIDSQVVFKNTGETMRIKFLYDSMQFQGNIATQQGFLLTGGLFNKTVTGTLGTVKWNNQGLGYIDESTQGAQTLTFYTLSVNISGTYSDTGSSTTTPQSCNTDGQGNCTTQNTGVTCYTTDFIKCVAITSTGTTPITIAGTLNCNSKNIVAN